MPVLGSTAVVQRGKQPAGALGDPPHETVVRIEVVERPAAAVNEEGDRQRSPRGPVEAQSQAALRSGYVLLAPSKSDSGSRA